MHLKPNILVCATGLWFEASSWGENELGQSTETAKGLKVCVISHVGYREMMRIDVIFNKGDASEDSG